MTRFDLLKQLDISLASEIIYELPGMFSDAKGLKEHLSGEISENELQQINGAAKKEGRQPLS